MVGSRAALMSLSADTEAEMHDFNSRPEQLMLTEYLTLVKLLILLTCDRCATNILIGSAIPKMLSLDRHLLLPAAKYNPYYLINTFTKVPSQHFAAQISKRVSSLSLDMPKGRFSPP